MQSTITPTATSRPASSRPIPLDPVFQRQLGRALRRDSTRLPCAFASAPPLSFVHSTATEFTGFEATRPRLRHPEARLPSAFHGKIRNTEKRGHAKVCPSARVLRSSRETLSSTFKYGYVIP
ncbi:hypothetical protein CABS01_12904 [Colletotrichum abscissum]|uniref:Uncharacterized protein n=3 Tax=Colletotrichum acutatum species complex TaxID=2707335 RepID=A0A9Q0AX87_9PEZI|nr:uncharacterized protein CLUP02_14778 [Colletotrichum lupini]XP_060382991.1 uncharacterized protein CTAM01_06235 [Colletotrichum tamarilloi]XP_060395401.1 uncharacterized protein CABS01_12904 [Colletotrichum abscissum]KAI3531662.1 hypothetical protein CABS02_14086 [Colletotrichum abscissum]KAK1487425.1 hypothetical protein CABS01_12904 [Colletotrichum abscissum]KAK1500783.1 hypothetical protein CTAM01_06235 [Colletotrichum tamarilloi]UQC89249.1 hypothetical protein CLUP02_14778 [Colletotric